MRTNALLLSVALAAGSTALAQGTLSKNIVGYVNVTVPTSLVMIANPLNNGGNTVEEVVKSDGELILYHFIGGTFEISEGAEGFWFTGGDIVVSPGGGFFAAAIGEPADVTFVGEVAVGKAAPIPSGLSIISSPLPKAGSLEELEFPEAVEGTIFQWDGVTYSAVDVAEGFFFGDVPQVGVAEAFWVNNDVASTTWTNSFSIE